jgi:5'-deoxynucleotidase
MIQQYLRKGGRVTRWHTIPTLKGETVAQHTYGVMSMLVDLCNGKPSSKLLIAALFHDIAEQYTGDIPATTKWHYPQIAEAIKEAELDIETRMGALVELTEEEKLLLKAADMLDLCWFCLEERSLGNKHVVEVYERGLDYINKMPFNQAVSDKVTELKLEWSKI